MVTVGMNYQIIEGKNEMFESVFAKVLEVMGKLEGHVKTNLFVDVADRQSYLILSEWSTRQQFSDFIQSEQFRNVANWGKEQVLASRPSHQYYGGDAEPTASKCPVGSH